jgi:DNA-binding response OmpR family regulator
MSFEAAEKIQDRMAVSGAHDQSNKTETVAYDWSINNTREVSCNGKYITKLPNLQFKLFECLYERQGKYVNNKRLEKCWGDNTVRYSKSLPDTMSKIRIKLKKGLMKNKIQVKDKVIEPKQVKKKNVAYKLVT